MLDTEPLAARAWGEAAATLGVGFDMVARARDDRPQLRRLLARCFARTTPRPIRSMRCSPAGMRPTTRIVEREGLALKPGVHELLDWLEATRIPRAVATSTRRDRARAQARAHGAAAALSRRSWAATRSRSGSPRRTSTSRPRGGSARALPRASCSRIPSPACARRSPPACCRSWCPICIPPSSDLLALDLIVLPTLHDVLRASRLRCRRDMCNADRVR